MLYDRQQDPHELSNLFDAPDYRAVQEQLHTLTLEWMARFRDHHVPWHVAKRHIFVDPAAAEAIWEPLHVESAALRGRPVDLIEPDRR